MDSFAAKLSYTWLFCVMPPVFDFVRPAPGYPSSPRRGYAGQAPLLIRYAPKRQHLYNKEDVTFAQPCPDKTCIQDTSRQL